MPSVSVYHTGCSLYMYISRQVTNLARRAGCCAHRSTSDIISTLIKPRPYNRKCRALYTYASHIPLSGIQTFSFTFAPVNEQMISDYMNYLDKLEGAPLRRRCNEQVAAHKHFTSGVICLLLWSKTIS